MNKNKNKKALQGHLELLSGAAVAAEEGRRRKHSGPGRIGSYLCTCYF